MIDPTHRDAVRDTIDQLAGRWAQADKQILRHVFPLLAEGKAVPVSLLVETAGTSPERVEAALKLGRAGRDAEGRVIELSGLTLNPTLHRVEIGEIALFSCCALLAQLVPELTGKAVRVNSIDPVSRRIVRLTIAPNGFATVEPVGALASFVRTEISHVAGRVGEYFCRHVHHFASAESASDFVAADPRRYLLRIDELREAAQLLFREAWASS